MRKNIAFKLIAAAALSALALRAGAACAAPVRPDASTELRATQQELLQREMARETERRLQSRPEALDLSSGAGEAAPEAEFRFLLTRVEHNPSKVLKESELREIFARYEGREVDVKELYRMVSEVNKLYFDKGYMVARAFLLPQKISGGVLRVRLVEGTTDKVGLSGNKTTDARYVLNSLGLKLGDVANFRKLNDRLMRFNMLNDALLKIKVAPGDAPETTQYVLTLEEPKEYTGSVFADNAGSSGSGNERFGFSYVDRSLTGWRDALALSGVFTEGSAAGYLDYSRQIGRTGARLSLGASANMLRANSEFYVLKSEAQTLRLRYEYPWRADGFRKQSFFAEGSYRWNKTLADDIMLQRQKIAGASAGVEFLSYGPGSAFYHSHTFSYNRASEAYWDVKWEYWLYRLFAMYQRLGGNAQLLTAKLNMTIDLGGGAAAADNFFLGGPYSVRGYGKDVVGAENGLCLNLEYALPIPKTQPDLKYFLFVDYGYLWGNVSGKDSLAAVGFGLRSTLDGKGSLSLSVGFPLEKDIGGGKVDDARFDCSVSWWF